MKNCARFLFEVFAYNAQYHLLPQERKKGENNGFYKKKNSKARRREAVEKKQLNLT